MRRGAHGERKLPDGRTVPVEHATPEELDLAIIRLRRKSAAHAEHAERLFELRRRREQEGRASVRVGPSSDGGWMTRGVAGIGGASFLADLGHEVPTALLPSFLTSTLGAPAAALGLIEGIADGLAGATRFAGGPLADDPHRRRSAAVGGYATTAALSGLIGAATSVWQVGVLRAGAWAARGLRVPSRNALLADVVPPGTYGRAYGFERSMDNLGAIGGPLLALGLIAIFSTRTAIMLSAIPGFPAVGAILTRSRTRRSRRRARSGSCASTFGRSYAGGSGDSWRV